MALGRELSQMSPVVAVVVTVVVVLVIVVVWENDDVVS